MTQEQYGQGTGSAVRGEVVPEDRPDDASGKPMTRFQKVASALRGDRQDDADAEMDTSQDGGPPTDPDITPIRDEPAEVTQPDPLDVNPAMTDPAAGTAAPAAPAVSAPPAFSASPAAAGTGTEDHAATQPDMFGTAAGPDPGENSVAAETTAAGAPGADGRGTPELRPGQATDAPGDFNDIAYGNLIPEAAEFRQRWQEIQFKFVDDPRTSVTEAADVVAQVTARLEAAIAERQRSLRGRWSEGSSADTETLRETLRMYRAFLDQLLGSR